MSEGRLTARLQLDPPSRPSGVVTIVNEGSEPLRLWRPGNSWGDESLTIEVQREGRTARFSRTGAEYTRNVPSSASVPAGGVLELPFDLEDGTWSATAAELQPGAGDWLVAIYEVSMTPEAAAQGVWVGCVRSGPVALA